MDWMELMSKMKEKRKSKEEKGVKGRVMCRSSDMRAQHKRLRPSRIPGTTTSQPTRVQRDPECSRQSSSPLQSRTNSSCVRYLAKKLQPPNFNVSWTEFSWQKRNPWKRVGRLRDVDWTNFVPDNNILFIFIFKWTQKLNGLVFSFQFNYSTLVILHPIQIKR